MSSDATTNASREATAAYRRLVNAVLIATIHWTAFALLYLFAFEHVEPLFLAATATSHALLLAVLRAVGPRAATAGVHVFAGLMLGGLFLESMVGGQTQSFALWFFPAVPSAVAYLSSARATVAWSVVTAAAITAVHLAARYAPIASPFASTWIEPLVGQVLFLAGMSSLAVVVRRLSLQREVELFAEREALAERSRELSRALDEALLAARTKSTFLANMSHELRTPLNAVIGVASVLRETQLSPEQGEYVETIDESSHALLTLISDVLDFSKLEAGKLEAEQVPFDVVEVVESAVDMVAREAEKKRLDLASVIDQSVPERVIGDSARTKQILVNLLSNAVKFTARGEVVARAYAHRLGGSKIELVISVEDTGIGIPSDKQRLLFRPFSQIDGSTTREYGGTGLGLAISHALTQVLGGRLEVESTAGRGSRFTFTLATEETEPTRTLPHAQLMAALAKKRVMILDDHGATREVVRGFVERYGATAVECATLVEAERAAKAGSFDLVFLDHTLGADGPTEIATRLRARPATRAATLILLARRGSSRSSLPPSIAAQATKPLKQERLARALKGGNDAWAPEASPRLDTPTDLVRERSVDSEPPRPLRVLVVEDNAVVRRVTETMVQKLGHEVRVVSDGLSALSAIEASPFDVVLMDVQMPELDGLETTRRLNDKWPRSERPRIVGLTANALPGDRERCLAAGMDGFLAKPIELADLEVALAGRTARKRRGKSSLAEAIDTAVVEELRAADEGQLLGELVELFAAEVPRVIAEINAAIAGGDAEGIAKAAHRLKGAAGTVGAVSVYSTLALGEALAREGKVAEATDALSGLEAKTRRALAALGRLRDLA